MNKQAYWEFLKPIIPKILGQMDRDPDSPTFGCFDRNFWNYKIRDFSSAIVQQGILVLDVVYQFEADDNPYYQSPMIKKLVEGSVRFWQKIQLRNGAFNEYYPFEAGFPPTAFSLYAIALLYGNKAYQFESDLDKSIKKAIQWLLKHPEKEALNQESAAISAMSILNFKMDLGALKPAIEERQSAFYNAQYSEGWFYEYGGPDIGYLAVTIDCLTDSYKITGDERAKQAALKAIAFINPFVTKEGHSPVMINARNTDYIVPYGIAEFCSEDENAEALLAKLLTGLKRHDNQLYKTDDRYLCHYIGQSFFRTLLNYPEKEPAGQFKEIEVYYPDAGIFIQQNTTDAFFISLKKGGILVHYKGDTLEQVDYGYRIKGGTKIAVSHWQDESYEYSLDRDGETVLLNVKGLFSEHGFMRPSPWGHMGLRIMSKLMGNKLIPLLKRLLIFNQKKGIMAFNRTIELTANKITISDNFKNTGNAKPVKAPHYSMRHVSSAGRFSGEELL